MRDGAKAWADAEDVIDRLENSCACKGNPRQKALGRKMDVRDEAGCPPAGGGTGGAGSFEPVAERIVLAFEPLCGLFPEKHTVAEQTYGLYEFITALDIEAQLKEKQFLLEQAETEYNGVPQESDQSAGVWSDL